MFKPVREFLNQLFGTKQIGMVPVKVTVDGFITVPPKVTKRKHAPTFFSRKGRVWSAETMAERRNDSTLTRH